MRPSVLVDIKRKNLIKIIISSALHISRYRNTCKYSMSFHNIIKYIQKISHYAIEWPNILQTRHDNCI